jgi:hypothetical protein
MIELKNDHLQFSFPEVHADAKFSIDFQRTLRIPDDGTDYSLPPGLGSFPLRHVDDFSAEVPEPWLAHGGVMLPMYQSEALWVNFSRGVVDFAYPFAVKIATGKINAVTGDEWRSGLHAKPQDYVVVPEQPWLDGYCVEKGLVRQFVAMPLGAGYTVEEQITGEAEHGGLQVIAYPMKRVVYERRRETWLEKQRLWEARDSETLMCYSVGSRLSEMGLAPGGRMRQEIYDDPYSFSDWDTENASRCFVHIANSMVWQSVTGAHPPHAPPTAAAYVKTGLPWFEYYSDGDAVEGSAILQGLKSVLHMGKSKGDVPLPENESVSPEKVIELGDGLKPGQVREGRF